MKKIKLLHVSFAGGGVDVAIRNITSNLDSSKFDQQVIREDVHESYLNSQDQILDSHVIAIKRNIGLSDFGNALALYNKIKKINPDIIHAHSAKAGVLCRALSPFIRASVLYTPHAFSYLSTNNILTKKIYQLIELFAKNISSKKDKIIACSNSERLRAINDLGYSHNRVILYNNSILDPKGKDLAASRHFNFDNYLLTISRPSYQKDLESMIYALKNLHDLGRRENLVILGVGYYSPDLEKINKLINVLDLDDYVHLLAWISHHEGLEIINSCKIYLSTSRYEGLPLSVIEAMALSKPIVATRVDGNIDLVEDSFNGFLINRSQMDLFHHKVLNLLSDFELYQQMSNNSRIMFERHFDLSKNISKLEEIYTSISRD